MVFDTTGDENKKIAKKIVAENFISLVMPIGTGSGTPGGGSQTQTPAEQGQKLIYAT